MAKIIKKHRHRLLCGDSICSTDFEHLMGEDRADMVFTDPPWNVNYGNDMEDEEGKPRTIMNDSMDTETFKKFMNDVFAMLALNSKKGCPTYIVMSAQEWGNMMLTLTANEYHWSSTIIWNKSHAVISRKDYHTKYEPIWYGWLSGDGRLCPLKDRKQNDVWDIDRPTKSELHPTMKPIALVSRAIENSSKIGDIVLDAFGGSGSTLISSEKTNRHSRSMELDPKYCGVILQRYKDFTGDDPIREDGLTFSEVENG